jgi:hypothetical protein
VRPGAGRHHAPPVAQLEPTATAKEVNESCGEDEYRCAAYGDASYGAGGEAPLLVVGLVGVSRAVGVGIGFVGGVLCVLGDLALGRPVFAGEELEFGLLYDGEVALESMLFRLERERV